MFYVSMFFQYVSQYMKTRLQYRADFFMEILSDLLNQVSESGIYLGRFRTYAIFKRLEP